jgi:acetyltransferase-like isoleucine patch superfamily enzyme
LAPVDEIKKALGHCLVRQRQRLDGLLFRYRQFLNGVYIEPGFMVAGGRNIELGSGVVIQRRSVLATRGNGRLVVGPGTRIGSDAVISVGQEVRLGSKVLIAARCYISDINHDFTDARLPILDQGITAARPVHIGDGSWLGINVCIMPGVTLGTNCVVGANSVVTGSFPDRSVVAGVPARLLKSISPNEEL